MRGESATPRELLESVSGHWSGEEREVFLRILRHQDARYREALDAKMDPIISDHAKLSRRVTILEECSPERCGVDSLEATMEALSAQISTMGKGVSDLTGLLHQTREEQARMQGAMSRRPTRDDGTPVPQGAPSVLISFGRSGAAAGVGGVVVAGLMWALSQLGAPVPPLPRPTTVQGP